MVFCYLLPGCNRPSIGQTVQDKGDKAQKSNERLFKFYPNLTEVGRRADYPGSVQALPVLPGRRSRSEGELQTLARRSSVQSGYPSVSVCEP